MNISSLQRNCSMQRVKYIKVRKQEAPQLAILFHFWINPPLQIVLGFFFLDAFETFFVLAHQHTSSSNTSKFRKGKINLPLSCRVNQAHKTPHQKKREIIRATTKKNKSIKKMSHIVLFIIVPHKLISYRVERQPTKKGQSSKNKFVYLLYNTYLDHT